MISDKFKAGDLVSYCSGYGIVYHGIVIARQDAASAEEAYKKDRPSDSRAGVWAFWQDSFTIERKPADEVNQVTQGNLEVAAKPSCSFIPLRDYDNQNVEEIKSAWADFLFGREIIGVEWDKENSRCYKLFLTGNASVFINKEGVIGTEVVAVTKKVACKE